MTTSYWNSCNFSVFQDAGKWWKHGDHRPPPTHGNHNLHPLGHTQGQRHRQRGPRDHQTSPRVGNHLPGAPRCVGREERRLPVTQETRGSLPLRTATLGHTPQRGGTCPASRTRRVRSPHGPPSIGKAAWDPGLTEGRDLHPWGSGQAGKASGSHPENRRFKSGRPFHFIPQQGTGLLRSRTWFRQLSATQCDVGSNPTDPKGLSPPQLPRNDHTLVAEAGRRAGLRCLSELSRVGVRSPPSVPLWVVG